jgi:transposase
MAHDFRPYQPDQLHLLPVDPREWLPDDHLVYLIRDLVDQLDLSAIECGYSQDGRGAPAYPPAMMVALLLYSWSNHVFSSRKIARMCQEDLGGRYLAAGHLPDHRTINDFRLRHGDALAGLFVQSLQLCQRAGMVSLGHVALDGTKLAANARKHKAMSYGRMVEEEARLEKEVAAMLQRAEAADREEDGRFGKEGTGSGLSEELARRESRLTNLRQAKTALEAEAREAAEVKRAEWEADQQTRIDAGQRQKGGRPPKDPETVTPKEKAQRNFTDPESKIMKAGTGGWIQGYNGQAAVDADHQVIVACDLTDQAADAPHLPEMIDQVEVNTGGRPDELSGDAGYFSEANITALESREIGALIPPDRERHGRQERPEEPLTEEEQAKLSVAERQRHRLSTEAGRQRYAKRKITVEPVFGQVKGGPTAPGFRGVLRRGLRKCRQEWQWVCATHNFLKYFRFQRGQPRAHAMS